MNCTVHVCCIHEGELALGEHLQCYFLCARCDTLRTKTKETLLCWTYLECMLSFEIKCWQYSTWFSIYEYLLFSLSGYHRALNQLVGVRHPNIWTFLRCLKDCQAEAEAKITAADLGEASRPRRRKWRMLEARIQRLKHELHDGERNVDGFGRAVAHAIWRP